MRSQPTCCSPTRARWSTPASPAWCREASHEYRPAYRGHRVRPEPARRDRGHQQGTRDPAHTADVRRQLHPRHRPGRRHARHRHGRHPAGLHACVYRRGVRRHERGRRVRGHRPHAAHVPVPAAGAPPGVIVMDTVLRYVLLAAAVCFVLGLHLMNHPATAKRGNLLSAGGMAAAVLATGMLLTRQGTVTTTGWLVLVAGGALGSAAGLYGARRVAMTAMPQLVSLFNAVGGGAAALLAVNDLLRVH